MDVTAAAARIAAMLPDQQTVTLLSRLTGDTFAAGVSWQAQRVLPAELEVEPAGDAGVARERASWRLFLTAGQTVLPQEGDRITDAGGGAWEVGAVDHRMGRLIFNCDVVKDQ